MSDEELKFMRRLAGIYAELNAHTRPRADVLNVHVNDKLDAGLSLYEYEFNKFLRSLTAFEQLQLLAKGYSNERI